MVTGGQVNYVYPGTPAHLQPPVKPVKPTVLQQSVSAPTTPPSQSNSSFFVSADLRMDILHKNTLTLAQPDPNQFPDLPAEVDNYHELCPLGRIHKPASSHHRYQTSTYKATSLKNGQRYCLRRIHGINSATLKYLRYSPALENSKNYSCIFLQISDWVILNAWSWWTCGSAYRTRIWSSCLRFLRPRPLAIIVSTALNHLSGKMKVLFYFYETVFFYNGVYIAEYEFGIKVFAGCEFEVEISKFETDVGIW